MLGESVKIRVRTGASEDLGVPRSNHAPTLTLESATHNRGTTVPDACIHSLIHEIDEIIREANRDLLTHTKTVADW